MIVYGYGRVSTDKQQNSMESQEKAFKQHFVAGQAGGSIPEEAVYGGTYADEDVSGGIPMTDRPAGGELFLRLKPDDMIIVTHLDRAFRSVVDAVQTLEMLTERGNNLIIISLGIDFSKPWGRMIYQVLASFAEFERQMIGMRVKESIAMRREAGRPFGGYAPIGYTTYRKDPTESPQYRPDAGDREMAREIVRLKDEVGLNFGEISAKMLFKGKRAGTGGSWTRNNCVRAYRAAKTDFPLYGDKPDPFTLKERKKRHDKAVQRGADS
tara:strand:- start:659 stop:1462 length:804 start_codon:yes stop_codon:yes gene_type:complete